MDMEKNSNDSTKRSKKWLKCLERNVRAGIISPLKEKARNENSASAQRQDGAFVSFSHCWVVKEGGFLGMARTWDL